MKRIFAAIATVAFAIYPSVCLAYHIIHLKHGGEFVTEQYWEEGEQIKFKRYGGVIGIQKNLVKKIEEIEGVLEEKAATAKQEEATGKRKKESAKEAKKIDVAYYQEEKKALQEKYQTASEKLEKARNTGNKALRREAKRELKEIEKLQKELAIKLKEESNGMLPDWWHTQVKPK